MEHTEFAVMESVLRHSWMFTTFTFWVLRASMLKRASRHYHVGVMKGVDGTLGIHKATTIHSDEDVTVRSKLIWFE